ncbi:MAG: hypothetical protein ACRDLP_16410 [Solirubrobacteraceae bacterium]
MTTGESRSAGRASGRLPPNAAELRVRTYEPGDEEWLVATFSAIFHERSLAEWRWLFHERPGGPAEVDIRVLEADGQPVGSVSHIGVPVWVQGERLRLAIGCDMMIHPAFRGRGGAEQMITSFRESGHGFDLNFGTVNSGSRHVTRRYIHTSAMRRVPVWTRSATRLPHRDLALRAIASTPDRRHGALASGNAPSLEVVELANLGGEVDELAADSAGYAPCIRIRDAAYLRWRWLEDPRTPWQARGVWGERGTLRGIAVIGVRGEGVARTGVIADILARDATTLRALLHDAWERLCAEGCHRVTCAYRDPRRWARWVLIRSGFRRLAAVGERVACGPLSPRAGGIVTDFASWYLTGGDTEL